MIEAIFGGAFFFGIFAVLLVAAGPWVSAAVIYFFSQVAEVLDYRSAPREDTETADDVLEEDSGHSR